MLGDDNSPVPASDAQFPEGRSFERQYNGNAYYQFRLVAALMGFHESIVMRGRGDDPRLSNVVETIKFLLEEHPELLQEQSVPDSDFFLPNYHRDPRLIPLLTRMGAIDPE